jgi:predicted SprT family Zn-dependent metalloprotease
MELGWGFYFFEVGVDDTDKRWTMAGCCEPEKKIGLSIKTLKEPRRIIYNALRHEMAHALAYEIHGPDIPDHGEEWKECCRFVKCSTSPCYRPRREKAA